MKALCNAILVAITFTFTACAMDGTPGTLVFQDPAVAGGSKVEEVDKNMNGSTDSVDSNVGNGEYYPGDEDAQSVESTPFVPEFNPVEKQKKCWVLIDPIAPVTVTGFHDVESVNNPYLFWYSTEDHNEPNVLKDVLIYDPIWVEVWPGSEIEVTNHAVKAWDPHFFVDIFVEEGGCHVSNLGSDYEPVRGWKLFNKSPGQTFNMMVTP